MSVEVFQRCSVHQVDCGDLIPCSWAAGRNFPFSSLFAQLLAFSFGFGPASSCRSPEGVCSCPDRTGLKEQVFRGLWLTQAWGRRGTECGVSVWWQRPVCLQNLRLAICSPWEIVPGSRDPGSGRLLRLPGCGGHVCIVTCSCTQASWWLQQQP